MNKIDKEFLNMEKCMEDMKYWIKGEVVSYLREIIPMSVFSIFFTLIASLDSSGASLIVAAIFWIPPLTYIIGASCLLIPTAVRIAGRKFTIVEDTLGGTNQIENRKGNRWHFQWKFFVFHPLIAFLLRNRYTHYLFYFEKHGLYEGRYPSIKRTVRGETSGGTNFVWSRSFRMGDAALTRDSHIGDRFYLLTYETGGEEKEQKVAFIYPQKFFIWEGEIA